MKFRKGCGAKCTYLVEIETCCKIITAVLIAAAGFDTAENEPSRVWRACLPTPDKYDTIYPVPGSAVQVSKFFRLLPDR